MALFIRKQANGRERAPLLEAGEFTPPL